MKQDKLTEATVKGAKPSAKQFKLSDGGGLYLLVHSNGSKYWRFDFRFDGKQKSSSLGVWPEVSLAEARSKRNEAKKKISAGVNPIKQKKRKAAQRQQSIQKKEKVVEHEAPIYQQVVTDSEQKQEPYADIKNTHETIASLKSHVYPELGEKPLSEFNPQDLTTIFKNIYWSRKEIFQIIWDIYPGKPAVQLVVLFILLFASSGFFQALITTGIYFILTVFVMLGFSLWNEKIITE